MDSAELLDLLGNANRRRILRLLAQKPCYVTEISEYLGVSPKAVIDHLRKLEEAGLVESRTDERRRKYFSISRNLRLEVHVSPYEFGTKSAYPANSGLDMGACRHLSVSVEYEEGTADLADLAGALDELEQLENELSLAQRWVQGRIAEAHEEIAGAIEDSDPRLVAALLTELAEDPGATDDLARRVEAPPDLVADVLDRLAAKGAVDRSEDGWTLTG
ncbi:metalloregulator ArsR/SmtB family transcription factor [Halobacteriales archaeon Cl-PHB]